MPQRIINGDFEATTGSSIPFWAVVTGSVSPLLVSSEVQRLKKCRVASGDTIKQSFSTAKASLFSFWLAGISGGTGRYKLYFDDGTTQDTTIPAAGANPVKIQRIFNPARGITAVEFTANNNVTLNIDEVQLWEESLPVEESDQPKISAQIFRGVHPESEDNWLRGNIGTDRSGSASTDGDVLTIYFTGSGNSVGFNVPLREYIDVTTYKTMVTRLRGQDSYYIAVSSGSNSFTAAPPTTTPSDWTIRTYDLSTAGFRPNAFQVFITGSPAQGNSNQWDYVLFTT